MDDDAAAAAAAGMPADHGGVAQLGEHQFCKLTVAGSMPVASITLPTVLYQNPEFTEPASIAGGHADSSASVAELDQRWIEDPETPVRIGSEAQNVVWGVDMVKPGSDRTGVTMIKVFPDGSSHIIGTIETPFHSNDLWSRLAEKSS